MTTWLWGTGDRVGRAEVPGWLIWWVEMLLLEVGGRKRSRIEGQRMSLVWETIIWRSLLDMALRSGFVSEVFHSLINLSFPVNGRRIHLRKSWQGLQKPLDRAKHLVRVACLLLYCCVFFSASSGRGGLSSEESVLSWWSTRLTTGSAWGVDAHADTLVHPSAVMLSTSWLSSSLAPFWLRIPGMRLCCGMWLFSAYGWRLFSYKHI